MTKQYLFFLYIILSLYVVTILGIEQKQPSEGKPQKEMRVMSPAGRKKQPWVCKLSKESGPCRAIFSRWYHNTATKDCEEFTYGGCRGNPNNFWTLEDCRKFCRVSRNSNKLDARSYWSN